MTMYAIVKTGGKQYRVEQGETLLVERLPDDEGATVALDPLLYRGDDALLDGDELSRVSVKARIVAHERGPKLRVQKFKPKRGYKRHTGHRQELTRLEVVEISAGSGSKRGAAAKDDDDRSAAAERPAAPKKRPAAAKQPAAGKEDGSDGA